MVGCSRRSTTSSLDITMDATVSDVDLGGDVIVRTWAWGGRVPGREIRLHKGAALRAAVRNALPAPTTAHWHGLAIPNAMDGVPVLTQQPIASGADFTYDFTVPDAGTYWAHSHVGTQLDRGLYAPLIIEDPEDGSDYDDELVLVLDDWIDGTGDEGKITDPDQVLANLRATGMPGMDATTGVTATTPLGSDGGDVTYPHFLVNGRVPADPQVTDYSAGQRIRIRVINAGSDTAFRIAIPDTSLTVTHSDGYPVLPAQAQSVLLGMGERVDAILTVDRSVPVVAVPEGKDGHAQLNVRVDGRPTNTDVDSFVAAVRRQIPLDTATLHATPEVTLAPRQPDNTLDLRLSGPVNGYTWPIDGMLYDPPHHGLEVSQGQRVRLRLINESMMFHPIHLHGHTFEVVGADGPLARKDTVLVAPMATVEVDFDADNPGLWITHCHNTYHLEAGMGTFVTYAG
ncbi:MAG: multicopper oxidase family protein [Mycobacterium sp.]